MTNTEIPSDAQATRRFFREAGVACVVDGETLVNLHVQNMAAADGVIAASTGHGFAPLASDARGDGDARGRARRRMVTRMLRLAVPVLAFCALGSAHVVHHDALLTWLLRQAFAWWVVDDPPEPADAIVVLAGNEQRAATAARLWREGYAPLVLISNCGETESDLRQVDIYRAVVRAGGVPDGAIRPLPGLARRTFHEAANIAAWARTSGARTILVVTDACHTRRARWLCRNEADLASRRVLAVAAPAGEVAVADLWRHPEQVRFLGREVVRFLFYWAVWPEGGLESGIANGRIHLEGPTQYSRADRSTRAAVAAHEPMPQ